MTLVLLFTIILGSLEDCYDELGSRYQLPVYVLSAPTNLQLDSSDVDDVPEKLSPSSKKRKRGSELPIRLQLSSGPVLRLTMRTNDSVLLVRQHVSARADVDVSRVRLFFAGKQLTDNTRLKDAGLRKNYTMQAVLSEVALSVASVGVKATDVAVAELSSSTEEPSSERQLSSFPTTAVSEVEIGISVVELPGVRSVENSEQTETCATVASSTGCALNTELTGLGTLSTVVACTESEATAALGSSTVPKGSEVSSRSLDTSF